MFSTHKFKAFSTFINTLSGAVTVTFAFCSATETLARIFSLFFITSRMEDSFLPYNLAISACNFFFYFNHIQNFHFLTNGKDIRFLLGLEAPPASLILRFEAIITVNKGVLNTNTATTRQLIRTARALEAEWWQFCGEAWVRGKRKISHVLGAFGLLDFTMLRPVLAWRTFQNL